MTSKPLRVSSPPPKPLLIWDGDCRFCQMWVERWRVIAAARADDTTFQQVGDRFPEIPREEFQRAVVYIDADGRVFRAAEAIFRSLRFRWPRRWLSWSYDHVAGFGGVSEFFYGVIARHRRISSALTKMLWGDDVRPPTYLRAQRWFLRGLGLVYLSAFVSFWVQIDGLVGANGILPVSDYLRFARDEVGPRAILLLPTLCWLDSSNAFLHFLCGSGVVLSILLILGLGPIICLVLLLISYLSLTIAGQTFLNFQWDILLLETGFLAIFFAPATRWMRAKTQAPVSRVGLFLLKLLLFKLMFMSGVVKLTTPLDDSWWNLTALDYHYWSQPLPTVFAWFADKNPEWFKKFSVAFCLVVEIVVPFFIWAPRRLRLGAAALIIALQLVIAITGNYCFFNLLTIVLCFLLIDDGVRGIGRWPMVRARHRTSLPDVRGGLAFHRLEADATKELRPPLSRVFANVQWIAAVIVLMVTLPLNAWHLYNAFYQEAEMPPVIGFIAERLEPFRINSGYGLFRNMTKDRREIVIEGSADGIDWLPYEFKWKPGDVNRMPGWCAPHQPRADWQMWFAALSAAQQNRWFVQFVGCLLQNKPAVTRLLAKNPFPQNGPAYLRARFYRYRFTSSDERRRTGAWWRREELGEYLPTVSLK
jgi:predicted DCC family thiol-disulfide oxidoreductase YuxK